MQMVGNASISLAREIEAAVYPHWMQQLQWVETLAELAEYCECQPSQVRLITGNGWYLLAAERKRSVEVVDLCALPHTGPLGMREVFSSLALEWSGKTVEMDCRKSTSYPLVMRLVESYGIQVLEDEPWDWGGEEMRAIKLKFPRR